MLSMFVLKELKTSPVIQNLPFLYATMVMGKWHVQSFICFLIILIVLHDLLIMQMCYRLNVA